jgi:hypothetical protein
MLIIDENLPASQRQLLRKWRIHFRFVGVDLAQPGTQDENLIPVLHKLAEPMFFTLDQHFFRADWAHASYGLAWLDVADNEAAEFIRRFLRHSAFDTQSKLHRRRRDPPKDPLSFTPQSAVARKV